MERGNGAEHKPPPKRARVAGVAGDPAALPTLETPAAAPHKRKRGWPRKHPLPNDQLQQRGAQAQAALLAAAPGAQQPSATPAPTPAEALTPPSARSFDARTIDASRMRELLAQQAAASGRPLSELWQEARRVVLQHSLAQLVHSLEATRPPPVEHAKPTAGVSYVVESESRQVGAGGLRPLPHLVIRPPGLQEVSSPRVEKMLRCVERESVAVATMPLKEENMMKNYLLQPQRRRQLLQEAGAALSLEAGAAAVESLLRDRAFICLHYHLDAAGALHACRTDGSSGGDGSAGGDSAVGSVRASEAEGGGTASGATPSSMQQQRRQRRKEDLGISDSNMQLGILIRKGVGGTCPLRAQARRMAGLLSALLGEPPAEPAAPAEPPAPAAAGALAAPGAAGAGMAGTGVTEPARLPSAATPDKAAAIVDALVGAVEASAATQQLLQPAPLAEVPQTPLSGEVLAPAPTLVTSLDIPSPATVSSDSSPLVSLQPAASAVLSATCSSGMEVHAAEHGGQALPHSSAAVLQPLHSPGQQQSSSDDDLEEGEIPQSGLTEPVKEASPVPGQPTQPPVQAAVSGLERVLSAGQDLGLSGGQDPSSMHVAAHAAEELAGEEGVEELLQEMEEESAEEAQSTAAGGSSGSGAAPAAVRGGGAASTSSGGAPLQQPRLSLYTFSLRLELYVEQETWNRLDSEARNVLHTVARCMERLLLERLAAFNLRRLREYASRLQATVGAASLGSPLARLLLGCTAAVRQCSGDPIAEVGPGGAASAGSGTPVGEAGLSQPRPEAPPGGNYYAAVALAAACAAAADAAQLPRAGLQVPWPFYFIGTRDCFSYHLVPRMSTVQADGRTFLRSEWFFPPGQLPSDYHQVVGGQVLQGQHQPQQDAPVGQLDQGAEARQERGLRSGESAQAAPDEGAPEEGVEMGQHHQLDQSGSRGAAATGTNGCSRPEEQASCRAGAASGAHALLPVGCTTYVEVFTAAEVAAIEAACDGLDAHASDGLLPDSCFHRTSTKGGMAKRTKYFFGARYSWTREQLAQPNARIAGGVRVDVPPLPRCLRELAEAPLVAAGLVPPGFVDSIACNMYHDGSEGLQSHFDDAARFSQPIFSLRLFSDCRLSFGTQLYGSTNGAFCIPLPHGAVLVLEKGSYAANGVKHCVRPMDMAGKSAALVLRRINPEARLAAEQLHLEETAEWMARLSLVHDPLCCAAPAPGMLSGHGRGGRPAPAAARREVWRCIGSMVAQVEQRCQQEQADGITAQLTLVSAVRKVEAASRLGLDLSHSGPAEVFSVLDDLLSWAERLERQQQRPGCRATPPAPPPPLPRRPVAPSAAEEVTRCLDVMVRAVEAVDRQERMAVCEVAASMVECVERRSAWVAGGCQGTQPAYVALQLCGTRRARTARKLLHADATPASSPAALATAGGVDFRRVALLAHVIAGQQLLASSATAGLPAAEVRTVTAAVQQQLGLANEAALRQALLAAAGGCATGMAANGPVVLTSQQQQAAVALVASALATRQLGALPAPQH